jgi:phage gp16-like protein
MAKTQTDHRRAELAKIHIAKKDLGMTDDDYTAMLTAITGKTSAGDLNARQRREVLEHLAGLGFKNKRAGKRPFQGKAPMTKDGYLAKIEAMLTEAGRPWAYVDAMGKHMFGIDRVRFCTGDQLRRIVAALVYDQKRREKKEQ